MNIKVVDQYIRRKNITRHSYKVYKDPNGNMYMLDRQLGDQKFYRAYGPYRHSENPPLMKINGKEKFGEHLTWKQAENCFLSAVADLYTKG